MVPAEICKIVSKMPKLLTATESTKPCYTILLQLGELIYFIESACSEYGFLKAISLEVLLSLTELHW